MPSVEEVSWVWVALGWTAHGTLFVLVSLHCLRRRREATSALLWMFLAWSFPGLGAFLYLILGVDRVQDKGFRKDEADQRFLAECRVRALRRASAAGRGLRFPEELGRALDAVLGDDPAVGGNEVTPLVTGDEAYPAMLEAIVKARRNVHLMTFILGYDRVGREFLEALAERARAGVSVRLMVDRFGSTSAVLGGLLRRYRSVPNFRIEGWTQANPWKRQFQVNLRNHRKILVVDGREAFLGGINLHEGNRTRPGAPAIRDYHFRIRGPVVHDLQRTFMKDWHFITDAPPAELLGEDGFPVLEPAGESVARVVNGGPTSAMAAVADVVFLAMTSARRRIVAVTPYFVPHRDILQAMRSAALRGLEVRLLVPERNNHRAAGYASRALYEDLLTAGVRIFERRPPFLHAKALLIDDSFALIGTSNLDIRSFRLDYETNLAIDDPAFAERLRAIVRDDFAESREVDLASWQRRPARQRMLENLFSLAVPVL